MSVPTALVTGGNQGLGLETSKQLAQQGWDVIVTARNEAAGRDAARSLGTRGRFVPLDVTLPASLESAQRALDGTALDALINNAGIALDGFDARVAERTLDTNYRGAARVTDAFLPLLSARAGIVMVSSGMGELSAVSPELRQRLLAPLLDRPLLDAYVEDFVARVRDGAHELGGWPRSAYRVSKIALNALTRILARSLPGGLRVNAVCPGWVRTRMGGRGASRSLERGAHGIVWAATLGADGPSGGFFRDGRAIDW
jgi:NAD(P)-dependent dehydrogenase (short-subunit alcohol dehydrogenase family)